MQQISFKGYVPVTFFAKNPKNGRYTPVLKEENIRKCQSFVIRNLNGTAKNIKNDEFVSFYKNADKDYQRDEKARSVYDVNEPVVYLITGCDVDSVNSMGRELRIRKNDAYEQTGKKNSYEAKRANKDYYNKTRSFLKHVCRRLKNSNGEKLTLEVFFEPKYTKKEGKLTGFSYTGARFNTSNNYGV